MLDKWIKKTRENITHPWPSGMIKRFMKLGQVFEEKRWQVFKAYEDDGGAYMGDEDEDDTPEKDTFVLMEYPG